MAVDLCRRGNTAVVTLNNPPVNAIGRPLRAALAGVIDEIEAMEGLERVILTGGSGIFAAGGDAREFDAPPVAPHLPDLIDRIEASRVPWIAAIEGPALGGGLELALGCRWRIASPRARLGLPETTLGVVPGAGGTQRLPRLTGLARAAELIATGKVLPAHEALAAGIVDALDDAPLAAAEAVDVARLPPPLSSRPVSPAPPETLAALRERVARRMPHQKAPEVAIDLVERAATVPFRQGLAAEREAFLALRQSAQARALRHIFFAERGARAPARLAEVTPADLARVAVVGGGTMGAGIAYAFLLAGSRVVLIERDAAAMDRARANVEALLAEGLRRGRVDATRAEALRAALEVTDEHARAGDAELAIEAVFEDMDVKRAVLSALEAAMPPGAVLASNTSYLDLDRIADAVDDPARVVGLHFFAPAHVMRLLEVVEGARTGPRALATGFAVARLLRKVPVVAGVCDGFIGNRILSRYREAADTLVMDGSWPWEVDAAMREFGYPMGPYEAQDLSGLDIAYAARRRQDAARDPARRTIPIADRLVEAGHLGRKSGAGWYAYDESGERRPSPAAREVILQAAREAGVRRRQIAHGEIRRRLLLAMINEAGNILHERIARSARDIDLVTVFGYGFPRWRGGLMHYADTIGVQTLLDDLERLAAEDPAAWTPSPFLRLCAEAGWSLADMAPPEA